MTTTAVVVLGDRPRTGTKIEAASIWGASSSLAQTGEFEIVDSDEVVEISLADGSGSGYLVIRRSNGLSGLRALVVDDDPGTRDYFETVLTQAGVSLVAVETAAEFREHADRAPFDFYLIDVRLPDANGFELCAEVLADDSSRSVLLTSAYSTPGGEQAALQVGARVFIRSPLLPDAFVSTVERALWGGASRQTSTAAVARAADSIPASLRLFGPAAVVGIGTELPFRPGRSLNILAALAAACPAPVSSADLTKHAWPPETTSGSNATYTAVSRLRTRLEEAGVGDVVRTSSQGYRLAIDPESVDVIAFETAARNLDMHSSMKELQAALELWGANPLTGVDTSLLTSWRRRLLETHARITELYALAQVGLGDVAEAEATAASVLEEHPWRESTWVLRIVSAYRAGRQADALELQRLASGSLRESLGLEPGNVLGSLDLAILTHDPRLRSDDWLEGVVRGTIAQLDFT